MAVLPDSQIVIRVVGPFDTPYPSRLKGAIKTYIINSASDESGDSPIEINVQSETKRNKLVLKGIQIETGAKYLSSSAILATLLVIEDIIEGDVPTVNGGVSLEGEYEHDFEKNLSERHSINVIPKDDANFGVLNASNTSVFADVTSIAKLPAPRFSSSLLLEYYNEDSEQKVAKELSRIKSLGFNQAQLSKNPATVPEHPAISLGVVSLSPQEARKLYADSLSSTSATFAKVQRKSTDVLNID